VNTIVSDTRALLWIFEKSDYRDLHLRLEGYSVFLAKSGGHANPMHDSPIGDRPLHDRIVPDVARSTASHAIVAPHIASLISTLPLGSCVAMGDIVARLSLLDEFIDLKADYVGTVEAVSAEVGDLLEYGSPILELAG
jgi:acetyl-CoA carboxylase biotin carboxyl carrier protein